MMKSVGEILGMHFNIPDYQRGYRWDCNQVVALLDDIYDFMNSTSTGEIYCLQPLVVKKREQDQESGILEKIKQASSIAEIKGILDNQKGTWDVIDGQQRLTTILIILKYLTVGEKSLYAISYDTRENSEVFLEKINSVQDRKIGRTDGNEVNVDSNIDFFFMYEAYIKIEEWFNEKDEIKKQFEATLLSNAKFIWYELSDEDDVYKAFTRLNIGKISLTDSELIKALLLSRSNFKIDGTAGSAARMLLRQKEIAQEWDCIETTLQNDEFWYFVYGKEYVRPTRIDFLFELESNEAVKENDYNLFRHYEREMKEAQDKEEKVEEVWGNIKKIFDILEEWYNSRTYYHYVGFLIATGYLKLQDIVHEWETNDTTKNDTTKSEFDIYLKDKIKECIRPCSDINQQYEVPNYPKTKCRPLLLLFNIQTVIDQNFLYSKKEEYLSGVFYKFPFHLYMKENWDIEHIDSHQNPDFKDDKSKKEYLRAVLIGLNEESEKEEIIGLLKRNTISNDDFNALLQNHPKQAQNSSLETEEKDRVWNFALLDSGTNRGYKNAPFPSKRRILIGREQGIKYNVSDDGKIGQERGGSAFVPPCTRNAFLKYYSPGTTDISSWSKTDAEHYREKIKETLNNAFGNDFITE